MLTVGLFGIGLDTYWSQFDGLLERLTGYLQTVEQRLADEQIRVVNAGMVDNPFKANEAAQLFRKEQADAIVLFISTYALSQNVLPVVQKLQQPLIILNLQPEKAIRYDAFNALGDRGKMTGEWLAWCQSCVAPELGSVLNRARIPYQLVSGYLDEPYVWQQTDEWLQALQLKKMFAQHRVGLLGHYYNGMLDVYSDLTQQAACFGNHFEIIEMGTLKKIRDEVPDSQIEEKIRAFHESFTVSPDCPSNELIRAARTSVALDHLVDMHQLGALAYYYEGEGDASYQDIVTSLIPGLTLLTAQHIPVAGEYEIKNVQAMKILDALGCGGSFSEFYALDFEEDIILLGHDGPGHFTIAEGKVGLVPLPVYHGKPGNGLSIQMKVRNGPVTLLSVCQGADGDLFLLVAEGMSEEGPTLQIGNTNSRYRFSLSIRDFIDQWSTAGPSHHCAIGVGHKAAVIQKFARLMNIGYKRIC